MSRGDKQIAAILGIEGGKRCILCTRSIALKALIRRYIRMLFAEVYNHPIEELAVVRNMISA